MVDPDNTPEPDARTLADLSAMADGTLDPVRAAAVRELIAGSPELSRRYAQELDAVEALRQLRSDRAPASLRLVLATRPAAPAKPPRRARGRIAYGGALAGAVAAVLAALLLLLPGGAPGAPSVSQAAALALRGPAMGPPLPDRVHGATKLSQDVGELYFPNWSRYHWLAVGQRIDHLNQRLAVTVFYRWHEKQLAYTILASPALRWPGTARWWLRGTELQGFALRGRTVVTWRRAGHTCILSGAGVPARILSRLAVSE